jgi:hypothetical protein
MFHSPDIYPPRQMAANRLIWFTLIITIGVLMAMINFLELKLSIPYLPVFLYLFGTCALISLAYRFVVHEKALFLFGETIAQTMCSSFCIMVTLLLGARLNLPMIDDALIAIDHFIGFDWREHAHWLYQQPAWFNDFLRFCYQSYGMQAVLLIPILFIKNQSDYGQRFVMAFYMTGMMTAIIATLLPAEAMFMHFNIQPEEYPGLEAAAARLHEPELTAMRARVTSEILYPGMGIVTFPSFHTVMAVLLIYVSIPFRLVRWIAIPINIGMIFATPFHGGHYLTDVIGGLVIAFLGIYWAERILPPRSQASGVFLTQMGNVTETGIPST